LAVESFPVEAGHIMMFARAIGDPNPVYTDEEYAAGTKVAGVVASPTYVQSSAHWDDDYPLRPKVGEPWFGSGRDASGVKGGGPSGGRGLHAEQHFEFFHPVRPGDTLSVTVAEGETWQKNGRSGTLQFRELLTEYTNQHGNLVVRARSVSVQTEAHA
jgi:acyl dehydratase